MRWQLLLNDPTQGVELPREQCREMSVLTTEKAQQSIVLTSNKAFAGWSHVFAGDAIMASAALTTITQCLVSGPQARRETR